MHFQGTQTKTLLAETQGEIVKEHTRLFEVIFFFLLWKQILQVEKNAPWVGCSGVRVCAGVWVNFQFSRSLIVYIDAGQILGVRGDPHIKDCSPIPTYPGGLGVW